MKLFSKLLALVLAFTCVISLTACKEENTEELDTTKYGWAYEIEEKTDDNGVTYAVIEALYLSDGNKYELQEEDYDVIDLVIGENGKINVPVYDEDGNATYDDNDQLITEEKTYEYYEIAEAAFAGQLLIGSVKVCPAVTKVGKGAFAGCSNIEKVELSFVGVTATDAVNAEKTFASMFGTAEAANCTAANVSYNTTGTATYYIPNALEEIVVNYGENGVLPAYAFNGLSTVKKITVTGITAIQNGTFANCTGLYEVVIPDAVTEIGKSAFAGCTNLLKINANENGVINFPASLANVYQEAFSGCSRLGYGKNTVVALPASIQYVGEKAFYNCTEITVLDLSNLNTVESACFYGCTSLNTLTLKAGATVLNNAFGNCTSLKAANVTNLPAEDVNAGFDFAE
ncbi:MAG: leucine-rich repeat domain-containing protein [Clostridia bacterium]|nr:leucine-rich repeat domain-containing protein [Clostridia bacterium]